MNNTKSLTIFAGVNGAGKSTLYYSEQHENLGIRLNSDEILHSEGWNWKDIAKQIQAGKKLLSMQKECFEKGLSFNRETTLSSKEIFNTVLFAKEQGYTIHLRYIGVNSPEIAKQRIAQRIQRGGHGVSEGTIERRFFSSKENFVKIFPYCDTVNIYDNSGSKIEIIACYKNGQLQKTSTPCEWVEELIQLI